jgi:hypothetical protein
MKLSTETKTILKNFTTINQSIIIRKGSVLRTISPQKNIFAKTTIIEVFDREVPIFDMNKFLGVLSLFKDPDLEFTDTHISVKEGSVSVKYIYADPKIITAAPEKDCTLPSTDVQVDVTAAQLQGIIKAASVIAVKDITLRGDGENILLVAHDIANPSSNSFDINLGSTDRVFDVNFKIDNLKLIDDGYSIEVSETLISQWTGKNSAIVYWIACQKTSKFL